MSSNGSRYLVTGADGFIGSHLVECLLDAGADVTALSLYDAHGGNGWLDEEGLAGHERLTVVRGDIRDGDFVRRLVRDHEIVFHLAALISIPYSYASARSYVDTNITGTLNLLEAARDSKVRRVIHTSTSEVYGTALETPIAETHPLQGQSPYAASKIGADMMAQAYFRSFDLPVVILRPFNTFGPRQSERAVIPTAIRQALDPACAEIRLGELTPRRDFTFVADTAAAFVAAATADLAYGEPYNCGSGVSVSIAELAARIVAVTGANKPVCDEPRRHRPEKSEVRELLADTSRFTQATGWRAATDLDQGLARTADWWRACIASGAVRRSAGYLT